MYRAKAFFMGYRKLGTDNLHIFFELAKKLRIWKSLLESCNFIV